VGGGSSKPATTLLTLNEMYGSPVTREELMIIGTGLGADVPFFILGKTAWASGIGDRFAESPLLPPLWLVLINPGFEISTKLVYQGLNLGLTKQGINYSIPRFSTTEDLIRGLTNECNDKASSCSGSDQGAFARERRPRRPDVGQRTDRFRRLHGQGVRGKSGEKSGAGNPVAGIRGAVPVGEMGYRSGVFHLSPITCNLLPALYWGVVKR
jgi:hypothetical protein